VTISLIAAVAANGVIGVRGTLPWRLPDDMARFRRLTMGHAVIMGRSTFASLKKPLAGRRNIVLSRDASLRIEGCLVVHSIEQAREAAAGDPAAGNRAAGEREAFVIGGAAVYGLFLPEAHRLYMTWIDVDVTGDAKFPAVDWSAWRIAQEAAEPAEAAGEFPHRFVDYERKPS
jgi:dihydrofolate reductase